MELFLFSIIFILLLILFTLFCRLLNWKKNNALKIYLEYNELIDFSLAQDKWDSIFLDKQDELLRNHPSLTTMIGDLTSWSDEQYKKKYFIK